ncbi:hypothetical protein BGZ76_000918 [Entomortierella beljakovae]|nr:hypothetical protein BGZ76_000918 [Entomortierella beljakovae]
MPPIPPTLPRPIQTQIDTLRKEYQSLENLINRLKNITGGTLSIQQELVRNAREESKAIEAKIDELRALSDEQDRESDRTLILTMLEKIEAQFKSQQQSLRQAILTSKQAIDREAKSERELLFSGSKSAIELSQLRRRGAGDTNSSEYLLNTSKDVNASLGRTLELMQQEVERTAHSAKTIDESSKTLKATVNEYQTYDEVLKRGKNLITKLNKADLMDRLLIGFGLLVFCLVVAYILKKRIADRGVSLIGYLIMPIRWSLSLLIPSMRAPQSTAPSVSRAVETLATKISQQTTTELIEKIGTLATTTLIGHKASTTTPTLAASTSPPQGFFGFIDTLVGDHGLNDEDFSHD